jgi:hypothetical protein
MFFHNINILLVMWAAFISCPVRCAECHKGNHIGRLLLSPIWTPAWFGWFPHHDFWEEAECCKMVARCLEEEILDWSQNWCYRPSYVMVNSGGYENCTKVKLSTSKQDLRLDKYLCP